MKRIVMPTILNFKKAQTDYEKISDLKSLFEDFIYETEIEMTDLEREKLDEANKILNDLADKVYNEGYKIGRKLVNF